MSCFVGVHAMIFQWNALPWLCVFIVLVLFFATGGDVFQSFPV